MKKKIVKKHHKLSKIKKGFKSWHIIWWSTGIVGVLLLGIVSIFAIQLKQENKVLGAQIALISNPSNSADCIGGDVGNAYCCYLGNTYQLCQQYKTGAFVNGKCEVKIKGTKSAECVPPTPTPISYKVILQNSAITCSRNTPYLSVAWTTNYKSSYKFNIRIHNWANGYIVKTFPISVSKSAKSFSQKIAMASTTINVGQKFYVEVVDLNRANNDQKIAYSNTIIYKACPGQAY